MTTGGVPSSGGGGNVELTLGWWSDRISIPLIYYFEWCYKFRTVIMKIQY
jgi:hypothetical protein